MTLVFETKYSQQRYSRGVCFRLSFKWAALSLVGGEFNYVLDQDGLNVDSTRTKHIAYRQVSMAKEGDSSYNFDDTAAFDRYVDEDGAEAANYINKWGVRFKGSKGAGAKLYNGVSASNRLSETLSAYFKRNAYASDHSLVYGYYGTENSKPKGHAVAFSKGKFFDSNTGVWRCDPSDLGGTDVDDYISQKYLGWPRKFVIFVLALQVNTGGPTKNTGCTLI